MGRILAFDYGTKRVGMAVTDPLQMIASPLDTVASNEVFPWLKKYTAQETVDAFVVGWPSNLQGQATDATQHVAQFCQALGNKFPDMPIHKVDERFTSTMATQSMVAAGAKKKDRQKKAGKVDTVSATLILQSYLEQQAHL